MIGSYGKGYSGTAPSEVQVAVTGRTYLSGGRPILWLHSAGAGASPGAALEPWLGANNTIPLLNMLTDLGCPVLSADCTGSGHWGNDAAQSRVSDMRAFLQSTYGASSAPVIVCGVSLGGLLALNWARANPTLTRALCIFYPCVNLQAQHDGTGGATASAGGTEAAYGGSLTTFNAAVVAHDPAQNTAAYAGVSIYMGYSDSDTAVGTANQTAWISAVGGSTLTTRLYPGAAHADMTRIDPQDVAAFLTPLT